MNGDPRLFSRACSPTLLAELLQSYNQSIWVQFPESLPGESGPRAIDASHRAHLRCRHAFIWWHLQEYGRDDAEISRILGRYSRRHGVAYLITGTFQISGSFCINDLTFRRSRGRIVSPPLEQFLLDRGVAPPDHEARHATGMHALT